MSQAEKQVGSDQGTNYPWFNSFNTHSIASGSICLSVRAYRRKKAEGRLSVNRKVSLPVVGN